MKPADPRILTINGGSSSIKFALFEVRDVLRRILEGEIERIGLPEVTLRVKGSNPADSFSRPATAPDHAAAAGALMDWIDAHSGRDALAAPRVEPTEVAGLGLGCDGPSPSRRNRLHRSAGSRVKGQ